MVSPFGGPSTVGHGGVLATFMALTLSAVPAGVGVGLTILVGLTVFGGKGSGGGTRGGTGVGLGLRPGGGGPALEGGHGAFERLTGDLHPDSGQSF